MRFRAVLGGILCALWAGASVFPGHATRAATRPPLRMSSIEQGRGQDSSWTVSALNFSSPSTGVVAAENNQDVAIFRTTDGGKAW